MKERRGGACRSVVADGGCGRGWVKVFPFYGGVGSLPSFIMFNQESIAVQP